MGSIQTQMLFKKLRDQYRAIGSSNVMLTQSNLVLVQPIQAGRTQYTFEILNNEGNPLSYEIRLAQTDAFHMTSMQLFFGLGAAPDDPEVKLLSYPNDAEIVNAGSLSADYRNIYNGEFDISIDNVKVIQSISSSFAEYTPQTQGIALGAGNAVDQIRQASDSTFYFAPTITLSGAKKNQITLTFPASIASAGVNQVLYLKLGGIVAISGSVFQS